MSDEINTSATDNNLITSASDTTENSFETSSNDIPKVEFRPVRLSNDSKWLPTFLKIIKAIPFGREKVNVSIVDGERSNKIREEVKENFEIYLQWQDENTCGIDIFQKI
jgi:hypothetical protein